MAGDVAVVPGMTFLDINTFFAPRGGGIRTYHHAKISYFECQSAHRYVLVYPGARFSLREVAPTVSLAEVYGPIISQDRRGYRFLLDYIRVFRIIRTLKPDVVEVGDPWLNGMFCLLIKKLGLYRGALVCFSHSDPIISHVLPRTVQGRAQALKRGLARVIAWLFYGLQRGYDLTIVSSQVLEDGFRARGVKTERAPLAAPRLFLEGAPTPRPRQAGAKRDVRLLFVGRLNPEKGIEVIKAALPKLLELEHVSATVIGRGEFTDYFAALKYPRFTYLGYVEDRAEIKKIYDDHDVLMATGPAESFPLAVIEAMARGLVVVGSDEGGTGELLRRAKSPFIFRTGDTEDFLRAARLAIDCDWQTETSRMRDLALGYGTLEDVVGRLTSFYASNMRKTVVAAEQPKSITP